MSNIEHRMSNYEGHDPLHTKNATGTPVALQAATVRNSSFRIRHSILFEGLSCVVLARVD